ncbi:DMT family transporter [Ketobacter sp.]
MPNRSHNIKVAATYAILTSVFATAVAAITKYLSTSISVGMIVFIQYLICLFTLLPWLARVGVEGIKSDHLSQHLIRGVAGWLCFYTYYLAISHIPLVDASLLRNTAPICVPFFMLILFKTGMAWYKGAGIALGFIGILLILKPDGNSISLWHGVGFVSGISLSLSMIYTRELSTTEPSNRILFYYFAISIVLSLPIAISEWGPVPVQLWPGLLTVGLSIFITMKLYNLAYTHAPANTIAPLSYFGVVFAGLLGWLIWDHKPDAQSLIGIALVIGGGIASLLAASTRFRKTPTT